MKKCRCEVLATISNRSTTFLKGEIAMVQFYKLVKHCDVWKIIDDKNKKAGVVTNVSRLKIRKLNENSISH